MIIHQLPDSIRQDLHPITVDLAGVGGTGSFFAPMLAKLHLYLKATGRKGLHVRAYDPKIVRHHVIPRQNFTDADVGENKAMCIIEKLNAAYNLSWEAYPTKFDGGSANITITCVDDAKFRNELSLDNRGYHDNKNYYWLDFGNGKNFGQVVLGSTKINQPKNTKKFKYLNTLLSITDLYGDLTRFEDDQGMDSCSTEESVAKQGLFNNNRIAVEGADLLFDLLKNKIIDYHGIIYNLETRNVQEFKLKLPKKK